MAALMRSRRYSTGSLLGSPCVSVRWRPGGDFPTWHCHQAPFHPTLTIPPPTPPPPEYSELPTNCPKCRPVHVDVCTRVLVLVFVVL